jgi:hypothetical protein
VYKGGKRCVEHVVNMRERCVQVLVGKLDAKRLIVRPRRRWEENTKMVLQGVWTRRGLKLSASGQGQLLCACEGKKGNSGFVKCWELID